MSSLREYRAKRVKEPSSQGSKPLVIAGPCSAETESQVLAIAKELHSQNIDYYRAGIWKPRTSPDSFEGVGTEALKWLGMVRRELGMKVTTEVANARHVEEALKENIDMLWIGARTTVNPFTVQEIADALKGVDVPVMIKNPINPDLKLWLGAVDRFLRVGIEKLVACHRGFNVYGNTLMRNAPLWEIPIDFRRTFPEIPMVCDPSHISGTRQFIAEISQKAYDLGFNGLMVETHLDPDNAWSDAQQQITPEALKTMLSALVFKLQSTDDTSYKTSLKFLREEIDGIDEKLISLLAARMDYSRKIGKLKKQNNISFYQYNRWADMVQNCSHAAKELGLHEDFMKKLFSLIHLESIDIQGE